MFHLLNLTPLSFSTATAQRNYRRILSVIHPDKNKAENAEKITKAVTHAYDTLSHSSRRAYYMQHGSPSPIENYDNDEADQLAEEMNGLLADYERSKHKHPTDQAEQVSPGVNVPELVESRFEVFLRQCREAAASEDQSTTPSEPTIETGTPDYPIDEHHDSAVASSPEPRPEDREVIDINTDSSESPIYKGSRNSQVLEDESPPTFFNYASEDEETSQLCNDKCKPQTPIPNPKHPSPNASPVRVPRKTFVDVGTSPFKPGDPVTFFIVQQESSGNHTPLSSKNLNFNNINLNGSQQAGSSQKTTHARSQPEDYNSYYPPRGGHTSTPGAKCSSFYIMEIFSMRTRPEGVKFKVKWGPTGHECIERAETVIEEKLGLRRWLFRMRYEEPRRFRTIMRFHPEFQAVLEGVPSGFYDVSGTTSNHTHRRFNSRRNATFG